MNINIKTIPHSEHRYETVGDYWKDKDGVRQFRVSDMQNDDYEFLVIFHELIEEKLTRKKGIKEEDISAYDEDYEDSRAKDIPAKCGCRPTETSEPGNDKHAPYFKEHQFATKLEKLMAKQLKVNWDKYDNVVINL